MMIDISSMQCLHRQPQRLPIAEGTDRPHKLRSLTCLQERTSQIQAAFNEF